MPLHLNDDEMNVLLSLAGPIDQRLRPQFLQEVAQELEANAAGRGDRRGPGASAGAPDSAQIFHPARTAQRLAALPQRIGANFKLENYGRGRDYRSSSVLAFSRNQPALVPPTKASMGVAGMQPKQPSRPPCVAGALTRSQILGAATFGFLARKRQRPGSCPNFTLFGLGLIIQDVSPLYRTAHLANANVGAVLVVERGNQVDSG
jgi:hypothetical protein